MATGIQAIFYVIIQESCKVTMVTFMNISMGEGICSAYMVVRL